MNMEEKLIKNFKGLAIPSMLLSLLQFDNEVVKNNYFSDGFEFSVDEEKTGLKTYSDEKDFLNSIYEFANSDGSGSSYGFWLKDGNVNLDQVPIVVFGSEGGYHIVACNLDDLLQILTFDSEPMIDWDEVYYYKDPDDFEPSEKSKEYKDWLKNEFNISPIDDADALVEKAQKIYKESFDSWVGKFYEE
ncbi:MAG: hypothetical protein HRU38_02800 [Saccharospirillaceae bacterium]|nr:hypothetical protein [Pseudomonadales bacterium]NRB77591.1 hypothetical protein [Saccharospirillaceae bacterium]